MPNDSKEVWCVTFFFVASHFYAQWSTYAVNRYVCTGETYEVEVTVDFPRIGITLDEGEKIVMALASTLRLDGKPDDDVYQPNAGVSISYIIYQPLSPLYS